MNNVSLNTAVMNGLGTSTLVAITDFFFDVLSFAPTEVTVIGAEYNSVTIAAQQTIIITGEPRGQS